MKAPIQSLSSPFLPKITSQYLEQLIRQKKKPEIASKSLSHKTYKKYDDKISPERVNRLTEFEHHMIKSSINHEFMGQHLDIKSPFYRRISVKHIGRWKCNCHCQKENAGLPKISKTHCPHHDEIIAQKGHHTKKFHDSIVSNIKQNHAKNNEVIERNKSQYLHYSFENSTKIKEQKILFSEKNRSQNENKIAKTITQTQMQKQFNNIFLKQRLDQMYQLDDENKPFEKILLKRDRWETKRNIWKEKILTKIHKKINQIKNIQSNLQKSSQSKLKDDESPKQSLNKLKQGSMSGLNQTRLNSADKQDEKILQDIENCLGVLLKNVSSISDLIPKFQSKEVKTRISQIFKENLNIDTPHYGKKLKKILGEIIEEIVTEQEEAKRSKIKKSNYKKATSQQFVSKENEQFQPKLPQYKSPQLRSVKSMNSSTNHNQQTAESRQKDLMNEKSSLQMKAEQTLLSTSFLSHISEDPTINVAKKQVPQNKNISILSVKSSSHQRKHSALQKLSFMSNSLKRSSIFSNNLKNPLMNDSIKPHTDIGSIIIPQDEELNDVNLTNNSMSLGFNALNFTPLISKQVISEREELEIQSDDQIDEEQLKTAKAVKYLRQAKENELEIEKNRIDGMINLFKKKILGKKQSLNQNLIPQKYHHINYENFCTQNTFSYIVSKIEGFEGMKKFKFIYNQLRAKKKILNDKYVEELVREFGSMIGSEEEVDQWKQFLLECRTKIMFESLNKMIDTGIQGMELTVEEQEVVREEVKEEGIEEEVPKECGIFMTIDESQIAFERYLQRLSRKNQLNPQKLSQVNKNIPLVKQQCQLVSQKTLNSQIEANSTKNIRYSIIEHKPINSASIKNKFQGNISLQGLGLKNKKKALQYLFRKDPQQFRQLNKNVTEVSKLFNRSCDSIDAQGENLC